MSTRKLTQALGKLMRYMRQLAKQVTKAFVNWVFRTLFLIGRRPMPGRAGGFVLPTTILLLLVVSISVGAISYRSFSRTSETIADRQQRIVYNTATPAIDRAKAKLEYMFNRERDSRLPSGIPPELSLYEMMLNNVPGNQRLLPGGQDPYTFPADPTGSFGAEERIDLNGDGTIDNAWRYRADTNGDGQTDAWVAYSIIFRTPANYQELNNQTRPALAQRANRGQIRNGPLSNSTQANPACATNTGTQPEAGWFPDQANTSLVRKNFQVSVYVLPDNRNRTVSTLEFQQDREYSRGNKWGAWFRNDLEIFPGPAFNWNGAMHTEGSMIVGNNNFYGYLISSPASCLYTRQASEVTVGDLDDTDPNTPGNQPFQGQAISGRILSDRFEHTNFFHVYREGEPPITGNNDARIRFDAARDSVVNTGPSPADFTLDPVFLVTEDRSKTRNVAQDDASQFRDARWNREQDNIFLREGRIYNQSEDTPFVDDSYRADNRFGPNPRIKGVPIPGLGIPITDAISTNDGNLSVSLDEMIRTEALEGDANAANVGLDGYWERRADAEGLKLVVSQRLELGNPVGWGGIATPSMQVLSAGNNNIIATYADQEGLRPWTTCTQSSRNENRCHESRQRRTLRDNLAAVQSMAVYHYRENSDLPSACVALTAHPGTPETIARAATFQNLNAGNWGGIGTEFPLVISNFFNGTGTNGWEYEPPTRDMFNPGSPTMRVLANLANYAGDPRGGAPSFPPVQDGTVHPYPSMAMWGDFSILRRILNSDNGSIADANFAGYNNLSPADRATLHTAACTLGMLAYNVEYLLKFDYNANAATQNDMQLLATRILQLYGNTDGNGRLSPYGPNGLNIAAIPNNPAPPNGRPAVSTAGNNFLFNNDRDGFTADNIILGLKLWRHNAPVADHPEFDRLIALAELIATREQVIRDIQWGFLYNQRSDSPAFAGNLQALEGLRPSLPKYPILHALFPIVDRSERNGDIDGLYLRDRRDIVTHIQYLRSVNGVAGTYRELSTANGTFLQPGSTRELASIVLKPRPRNQWVLPSENAGTGSNPTHPIEVQIKECLNGLCDSVDPRVTSAVSPDTGTLVRIPFKDSGLMNGREMMTVRVLDIDLDLLRTSAYRGNFWLPVNGNDTGGIIYAFREDAVAEGSVTRPSSGGTWAACGNNTALQNNQTCRMNAGVVSAYESTDPPLNVDNGISPKPVDYAPDPDRRPHGFRLRKGATVMRPNRAQSGLTFISDNPVYIQGDFNLHQTALNGQRLEEFTQLLNENFNNFYQRATLDARFSRPDQDLWRPTEVLADAVTTLPDNFCDGSIEDGFLTAGTNGNAGNTTAKYNCAGNNSITSYLNHNRPRTNPQTLNAGAAGFSSIVQGERWQRENPLDRTSPIKVTPNGNGVKVSNSGEYGLINQENYYQFQDAKSRIGSNEVRQNAIVVSGLVPSRPRQSYGGLHNFPRFISDWGPVRQFLTGSFIQLTFSRYATGPFDQNVWEPGQFPTGQERIQYYGPPNRRWGYDVGLQYAPAGPLASRFISAENTRNEFYSEPPADDPYMLSLCRAIPDAPCN
jgi:hypothetical protein